MPSAEITYSGVALPVHDTTVVLFDSTVVQHGKSLRASMGYSRVLLDLGCDKDGTLKWYKSPDRGTTWTLVDTLDVVGAASGTAAALNLLITSFSDFRLDFLCGTTTQTRFVPAIAATTEVGAVEVGSSALPKVNFVATTDPGVGNDTTQDYDKGSLWFNRSGLSMWFCTSATTGAATWAQLVTS